MLAKCNETHLRSRQGRQMRVQRIRSRRAKGRRRLNDKMLSTMSSQSCFGLFDPFFCYFTMVVYKLILSTSLQIFFPEDNAASNRLKTEHELRSGF